MKITRLLASSCAILLSVCALSLPLATAQQSNNSFTIEQALSSPFPSDLVAAPTGARIAWAFDAEGKRNVWAADGPDFKARQLTRYDEDTGQELSSLQFTHDGKWVVYVRGGDANTAGEIPNPTSDPVGVEQAIYAVSFADGRTIKLANGDAPVVSPVNNIVVFNKDGQIHLVEIAEGSEPHPLFAARGTNASQRWSPDGRRLAFVSNRGSHSLIGIFNAEKRSIRYLAPSVDRDTFPRWSPDGKRLAFIRQPARAARMRAMLEDTPDPWAIMVADAETGEAKEVWRSGSRLEDSLPRTIGENVLQWTKSGSLILASEKDGWLRLYSIAHEITPPNCEVEHVTMTPDGKWLIYSSNRNEADRRAIWIASADATNPTPIKALTPLDKISWEPVVTGDGKFLAYLSSDERTPAMPFVMPLNGGPARMIASEALPPEFPASKLVAPQQVIFKAADGLEIHGQLFLPPNAKPADKLPAVIFMHGGPMRQMLLGWHYMYYYHNTYAFNQYLASRGYAVLSVNFRAGIGYGRAFREAPKRGARGASEYQDVVSGANYLRSRADIDPSKIGLWGGSYGGYLTAMGLARNSDLFAAGVDLHGVHDWSVRISGASWIEYGERDAMKIAREASPMGSVEKWKSPVLLIHGDDDRNVAFSQTVDLVRKLRELKVEHEVIVFPDDIHDFLLHRHWLEIFNASAKFLDKHLKGGGQRAQRVSRVDTLIRGGSVIDGTGSDAIRADAGITGDRIVFIGDAVKEGIQAARTIDANGLIVAPGFIDPHTHADDDLFDPKRSGNLAFLSQGVTTVFIGSDGRSRIPLGKAMQGLQAQGIGTNVASFVGHGAVRQAVMGMSDAAPAPEQLEKMKTLVRQGMEEGAIGLSTGLYYAPGSYAKTEEVIELAKVAAERGGVYDTHQRDESSYTIGLLGSIEEVLRIGREARLPVHVSHIKALGADVWGQSAKVIEMIERARAEGLSVTANQYPYVASGTGLGASLLPRWAEAGGREALLKRIDDPALRPKLIAEMEENLRRRGGANSLLIRGGADRSLVGKRLDAIAKSRGKSPVETALEIIKAGNASVTSFNMTESDIEAFMKQPWVMTGSDGSSGHPRKYGTYPRKIREYVLNRKVISLPRMIQASSLQVAETFHLKDRGKIGVGYFADLVLFDEKTIADRATYEQPELPAEGVKFVLMNGKAAIDGGKFSGTMAGRALRKSIAAE